MEDNNPYEFLKNLRSTAKELLLLYKMEKLNIPLRFIRYVRHFLSRHKTKVDINRTKSDPFHLDEGLPQGSSISPLLLLIFINDIEGWENAQKQQITNAARNWQNIRVGIKVEDVGKRKENKGFGLLHINKRSEVGSEVQSRFADRENCQRK